MLIFYDGNPCLFPNLLFFTYLHVGIVTYVMYICYWWLKVLWWKSILVSKFIVFYLFTCWCCYICYVYMLLLIKGFKEMICIKCPNFKYVTNWISDCDIEITPLKFRLNFCIWYQSYGWMSFKCSGIWMTVKGIMCWTSRIEHQLKLCWVLTCYDF